MLTDIQTSTATIVRVEELVRTFGRGEGTVRALPGAPARAVEDWMLFFGSRYERVFGRFAPPVHDPCTVALLIDPSLMTLVDSFVAIETEGRWTRGATVVDLHGRFEREPNARVAMELDATRFWDLVIGALEKLA